MYLTFTKSTEKYIYSLHFRKLLVKAPFSSVGIVIEPIFQLKMSLDVSGTWPGLFNSLIWGQKQSGQVDIESWHCLVYVWCALQVCHRGALLQVLLLWRSGTLVNPGVAPSPALGPLSQTSLSLRRAVRLSGALQYKEPQRFCESANQFGQLSCG